MHEIIMGYQGEMSLKGLNRNQFESAMMKILRYRLKTVGKFKVYCTQSTFYMEPEEEDVDMDLAFDRVSKVFGLAALSRAVVCDKDFDTICQTAEDYLGASLHGIRTFKVEARRSDKTYPMTSPELMRELGAYLLGKHNYLKVDVHNPQFKVIVEIRDYGAYIHGPKIPGEGGLPVGTSGRALNMLSGGIDSPVAAYRMAKRGLALDHIHFASPPYTSERAKLKVKALAQKITPYTGSSNLFVVPYTKPQEYIRDNAPDVLFTVLMRRSMMRIANVIAKKQGCEALITGESLAQVASQTVKALQCTDAAQDLPILRPLIGMDKTEIVETARHINTFETSILPYEDCCTIFTPPHPKTKPSVEEILEAEAAMPGLAELEEKAAAEVERIAKSPGFKGYLSDVGAPSANMYRMGGRDRELCSKCRRPSCLHPKMCPNLDNDHRPLLDLYAKVRAVKGVKKAFIGSGIRYDLFDGSDYLDTVIRHHTSGRLKVAPEHTEDAVLKLMRKPPFVMFERLNADFNRICRREGLPYQLIPYFISSHPGCTERDMRSLADKVLGKLHFDLEQVQDLTPTPMTFSSVMFYTGENPYTGEKVYVARSQEEKRRQKSYFFRRKR